MGRFWKLRRIPLEQCHCLVFQQMCLFGCPNLLSNHSWMSRPGVSFDNPKKKKKVCKWAEMSLVLSPCKNLCDMGNYKWVTMLFVIEETVCLYIYFKKNKNWGLHLWYVGSSLLFVHDTIFYVYRMCKISTTEKENYIFFNFKISNTQAILEILGKKSYVRQVLK